MRGAKQFSKIRIAMYCCLLLHHLVQTSYFDPPAFKTFTGSFLQIAEVFEIVLQFLWWDGKKKCLLAREENGVVDGITGLSPRFKQDYSIFTNLSVECLKDFTGRNVSNLKIV